MRYALIRILEKDLNVLRPVLTSEEEPYLKVAFKMYKKELQNKYTGVIEWYDEKTNQMACLPVDKDSCPIYSNPKAIKILEIYETFEETVKKCGVDKAARIPWLADEVWRVLGFERGPKIEGPKLQIKICSTIKTGNVS